MTSHHDVAGVMARAKTKAALLRMGEPVAYGSDAAAIEDLLAIVESQAKALSEAEREATAYHGFWIEERDKWLAAEGRLAEAMKVIERDMEALTEADTQIEYLHDKFKPTGSGANAIARIDIALTAARAFTNAAKEKT